MGQRNTICTQQLLDLEPEQGYNRLHPDYCVFQGNIVDYTDPNAHVLLSGSGISASMDPHQLRGHQIRYRGNYHGNQYSSIQNRHPVPNLDIGAPNPSNFFDPYMLPLPSGRTFPVPHNIGITDQVPSFVNFGAVGTSIDEFNRNSRTVESLQGHCKRKNLELVPGNYFYINGSASSSSSSSSSLVSHNSGPLHWEEPYESVVNLLDMTFIPPDCQVNGTLQTSEGSFRTVRNISDSSSLHTKFAFVHHPNYWLPGNCMSQSFQPASNPWVAQTGETVANGACSTWNPYTNLHGRCPNSRTAEVANMGVQGYQEMSSSMQPASVPYYHQNMQPIENMQAQSHINIDQFPASSYQHPVNCFHPSNLNPSRHSLHSDSRFPFFSSSAEQIYRPPRQQLIQASPVVDHRSVRILSPQDAASLEFRGLFGVGNVIDEHRDMRLDIDAMSYEELLALEEQIGDVNTGLAEEFILENLKISIHIPKMILSPSNCSSRFSPENEACVICQVEYEEKERIGTLDCSHNYHADCIKQWLLVKNLCPICKTAAFNFDKSNG